MANKGIPLTDTERRSLFEWVLAVDIAVVAKDLTCSEDSIANWIAGLCAPFALQRDKLLRRLKVRASKG